MSDSGIIDDEMCVVTPSSSTETEASGIELPLDINPNVLLSEQEKDATLTPLWEMAGPDNPDETGYYIKHNPIYYI